MIYQKIKDYQFLYQENKNYQQIERIKKEEKELLKLHNQKYLKRKKEEYISFFKSILALINCLSIFSAN